MVGTGQLHQRGDTSRTGHPGQTPSACGTDKAILRRYDNHHRSFIAHERAPRVIAIVDDRLQGQVPKGMRRGIGQVEEWRDQRETPRLRNTALGGKLGSDTRPERLTDENDRPCIACADRRIDRPRIVDEHAL